MILNGLRKFLNENKRITVLDISETYANKGTKKYFRMYAEVERTDSSQ